MSWPWKRRDVEVVAPDEHFSVAGAKASSAGAAATKGPPVVFEIVHEDEPLVPRPLPSFNPLTRPATPSPSPAFPRGARTPPPARPPTPHASSFMGPQDGVTTEWARRLVGPAPPGRAVGQCGKCHTRLAVSMQPRPLRVCCPECGRSRVLA